MGDAAAHPEGSTAGFTTVPTFKSPRSTPLKSFAATSTNPWLPQLAGTMLECWQIAANKLFLFAGVPRLAAGPSFDWHAEALPVASTTTGSASPYEFAQL